MKFGDRGISVCLAFDRDRLVQDIFFAGHDVRCDDDHDLGLFDAFMPALEEVSNNGDVHQIRKSLIRPVLFIPHQTSQHHGDTVLNDHGGVHKSRVHLRDKIP